MNYCTPPYTPTPARPLLHVVAIVAVVGITDTPCLITTGSIRFGYDKNFVGDYGCVTIGFD